VLSAMLPHTGSTNLATADSGNPSFDRSIIRIAGTEKRTQPVVIDTSLPTIVPASATVQASAPQTVTRRVREARAEVPKIEPVEAPKKKKVAAHRKVHNTVAYQPFYQPPHVAGLFSGW
jgi:hypothetical protein